MKLGGWWAQRLSSRFAFPVVDHFDPVTGAAGWQASNPPPLLLATLSASLEVWSEAGLQRIVDKAELLTLYVSLSPSVSLSLSLAVPLPLSASSYCCARARLDHSVRTHCLVSHLVWRSRGSADTRSRCWRTARA